MMMMMTTKKDDDDDEDAIQLLTLYTPDQRWRRRHYLPQRYDPILPNYLPPPFQPHPHPLPLLSSRVNQRSHSWTLVSVIWRGDFLVLYIIIIIIFFVLGLSVFPPRSSKRCQVQDYFSMLIGRVRVLLWCVEDSAAFKIDRTEGLVI